MKERKADLFETIFEDGVDAICITTNGHYTKTGGAVMGGGCAGVCARRWPETSARLGKMLKTFGKNIPFVIGCLDVDGNYLNPTRAMIKDKQCKVTILSYPTINQLIDGANIQLVLQSAALIKDYADNFGFTNIMVPRPGVGIGGLQWSVVKPALSKIMDDRFTVVSFDHEEP